ncbi:unnamed protein product [Phyllotreta striolata]|uniref:Uncharacterized protein n=1 Tax=Phyllotreta striolata TaxID=444603 RepID=A0A9N9TD74_PHYSR|nr:unnamed protein product [Phyllotreta striolata]
MIILAISAILILCILLRIYIRQICFRCKSNVCLSGKTALITGGSLGIGYHIVCNLASRGCKVIVADEIINEEIKDAIYKETKSDKVSFEYVDLASFASVRKLAEKINSSVTKLDIFIYNAGIGKCYGQLSKDGLNKPMQINYYSAFLLTHLLVGLLKKSSSARIIFTSSGLSFFNAVSLKKNKLDVDIGSMIHDYNTSKFCMIAAADKLSNLLQKYNITSNSYHPGIVKTRILSQFRGDGMQTCEWLMNQFLVIASFLAGKSPEEGAQTGIHLACANEVENVTGKFFGEGVPRFKPYQAYNKKLCDALWRHSEEVVQLKPEEMLASS